MLLTVTGAGMIDARIRFRGCLLGLACGDAVGTAVEFEPRGAFAPLTGMAGGGPFGLEAGQWTDDTSMALCLAESLIASDGFNAHDQMSRYVKWWKTGYLSSTGRCFDIGMTVRAALQRFEDTGDPFSGSTNEHSAGNGCIMRLAPVPMYFFPDWGAAIHWSGESARTTHGALECVQASQLFGSMLFKALAGADRDEILFGVHEPEGEPMALSYPVREIAEGGYRDKQETAIVGSGYVIKSLEAALWCFWTTSSFEEAVLRSANLGDDADTTAAICGQLAGAFYGADAIPGAWMERLVMRPYMDQLARQLLEAGGNR